VAGPFRPGGAGFSVAPQRDDDLLAGVQSLVEAAMRRDDVVEREHLVDGGP
jgi:hypothetical protein